MHPDHRASRLGRRPVLARVAAVGVMLALLAGTSAATAGAAGASSTRVLAAGRKPLAGRIIGIDPGHNGLNWTDPAFLDRQVWNGREWENCDTTGTQTAGGYTEARFNWNVATYLRADLIRQGARVVLTRTSNHGVGPCVNTRARILDRARANRDDELMTLSFGPSETGSRIVNPRPPGGPPSA